MGLVLCGRIAVWIVGLFYGLALPVGFANYKRGGLAASKCGVDGQDAIALDAPAAMPALSALPCPHGYAALPYSAGVGGARLLAVSHVEGDCGDDGGCYQTES